MGPDKSFALARKDRIEGAIRLCRGQRVLLDSDIARLYGVTVASLNQAVKRNASRFPSDFMFRTTREDLADLGQELGATRLKSQFVISKIGRGGRRSLPCAFTEQGVAMLSSVLRSARAIHVNIEIMRAFVRLRGIVGAHADLARKVEAHR